MPCQQLMAALSGPRSTSINSLSISSIVAWTQGSYKASMPLSNWYLQPFAAAPTSPMTPRQRICSWWMSGCTAAILQLVQMQLNWVGDVLPHHAAQFRLHGAACWQPPRLSATWRRDALAAHAQHSGTVALPGGLAAWLSLGSALRQAASR